MSNALPVCFPSHSELSSVTSEIRDVLQKTQVAEVSRRVAIARQKFHDDWQSKPAIIFAKVNPTVVASTYILQDEHGKRFGISSQKSLVAHF